VGENLAGEQTKEEGDSRGKGHLDESAATVTR
jgi:hypothetical protein